ncbi:MAG: hypothetical protein E7409_03375 [Ruminococcaceae bacterium]|nr:hypothetical protein [Oscillospiraceae bacterium]
MKRVLICLFIFTMLFSGVTMVSAQETKAFDATSDTLLSALGIDLPYEYEADRIATKSEFVYLLAHAADALTASGGDTLVFSDVKLDFWAHDAIVSARAMGWILGHGDGTFGPDDTVSSATAADIAMGVLGFKNVDANYLYHFSDIYNDLLKGIGTVDAITIAQAMTLIENMFDSQYLQIEAIGQGENSYAMANDKTFLEYKHNISKHKGTVTGTPYAILGAPGVSPYKSKIIIDNMEYNNGYARAQECLGYEVWYYLQEDETGYQVVYMTPVPGNEVTVITSRNLTSVKREGSEIVLQYDDANGRNRDISFPITCDFVYNGKTTDFQLALVQDLLDTYDGEIRVVETKGTCFVSVKAYTVVMVEAVTADPGAIYGDSGEIISVDTESENGCKGIYKNGVPISLADIKKGNIVQVLQTDGEAYEIAVMDYSLSGTVEEYAHGLSITIDGATYELSNHFKSVVLQSKSVFIGMKTTFYFNSYGQIVDFNEDNIIRNGEYMYLIDATDFGGMNPTYRIRAVRLNASFVEYDLADKLTVNDSETMTDEELYGLLKPGGTINRGLVFAKVNEENKIHQIHLTGSDKVQLDAPVASRKNKNWRHFLAGASEAFYPEFYVNTINKFLQIPAPGADDATFADESNYKAIDKKELSDNGSYMVSAYNFNDFNVPEIVLVHADINPASALTASHLMVVDGFGSVLDADGYSYETINGFTQGKYAKVKVASDDATRCTVNGVSRKLKKGDVILLGVNNEGNAFVNRYVKNVEDDLAVVSAPEGRQDGETFIVAKAVNTDGTYFRIAMSGSELVNMCRTDVKYYMTVYDRAQKKCYPATMADFLPGSTVIVRLYYSAPKDIIIIR